MSRDKTAGDTANKNIPDAMRPHSTRKRQERRIRWQHGLSATHAALMATLVYGGGGGNE